MSGYRRNQTAWWKNSWPPAEPNAADIAEAIQIKATTGLGKTQMTISSLASDPSYQNSEVHFYVPDNKHAAEVARIAGHCARYRIADKAAKAGLNVYRTCCQQGSGDSGEYCRLIEECPYLKQWADEQPAFRIFVHQYVYLPKPTRDGKGFPRPALAVVDESFWQKSIIAPPLTFHVDRLWAFSPSGDQGIHGGLAE
ncbi:hypothetical protein [uncultured Aliiroseovarius sp.]|uniref:hypothetical protein n=1 Tax=uncultured Aliiroseovarius sp. TaxID=1658783 RepID=UPI002610877A|nr:hypothetical protein [uncultured Aliiroseovarius sp.]